MIKRSVFAFFFVLSVSLVLPVSGYAQEMGADGEYNWSDKLGRGVVNFFTSPLEIPRNINNTSEVDGAAEGWTIGLVEGLGMTLYRAGAGLVETVTFPFDWPGEGKEPLIEPKYAWQEWKEAAE